MTATETAPVAAPGSAGSWLLTRPPKASLLPPSILAQAALRRSRRLAALLVAAAVAVLVLLWLWANAAVGAAQESVDAQQAVRTQLLAQSAKYVEVPQTKAALATSQQMLSTAMAADVSWSKMLAEMAATRPAGVNFTQIAATFSSGSDAAASGAASASAPPGSLSVGGTAATMDQVAAWLDVMGKSKSFSGAYVTSASRDETGGAVTWQGTAGITDAVLSHDYDAKAG